MDTEDSTPRSGNGSGRSRARLAAVLGTAALAIPGGMLVSNAFAADGSSDSGSTTAPIQQSDNPYAPAQNQDGDGRDCPKEDGAAGQGDSGQSEAPSSADTAQQTAL